MSMAVERGPVERTRLEFMAARLWLPSLTRTESCEELFRET